MKEADNFEKIIAYTEGTLSAAERTAFEKALANDTALKNEFALFQQSAEVVDVLQYEYLRNKTRSFGAGKTARIPLWRRPLAVAASVFLLLAAMVMVYSTLQYTDHRLANDHYSPPNLSELRNGGDAGKVNPVEKAMPYFNKKEYKKAADWLRQVGAADSKYIEAQYMLGHVFYQSGSIRESIEHFLIVRNAGDKRYVENATWQLALGYLKIGEEAQCRRILEEILRNKTHGYFTDADRLQQQLNTLFRKIAF